MCFGSCSDIFCCKNVCIHVFNIKFAITVIESMLFELVNFEELSPDLLSLILWGTLESVLLRANSTGPICVLFSIFNDMDMVILSFSLHKEHWQKHTLLKKPCLYIYDEKWAKAFALSDYLLLVLFHFIVVFYFPKCKFHLNALYKEFTIFGWVHCFNDSPCFSIYYCLETCANIVILYPMTKQILSGVYDKADTQWCKVIT